MEIFKLLLEYYKQQIELIPEKMKHVEEYLFAMGIDLGVCRCASTIFKVSIINNKIVKKFTKTNALGLLNGKENTLASAYWARIPMFCKTREEVIECLQKRIDILQEIVDAG